MTSVLDQLRRDLQKAGHEVTMHLTAGPGDATAIASQLPESTAAAIAVGGDGTVREVSQGLLGRDIPLAVLPAGTENLVARHFNITARRECLLDTLLRGATRKLDVGRMGDRIFLVVAGIGFDAEVVRRLSHNRRGHITRWSYLLPLWRTFWDYRFPRLKVVADGELVFDDCGIALIGNLPRYGAGLDIHQRAVVDDGLLDLCIFPCCGRAELLSHAFRVVRRKHLVRGGAIYIQARRIEVSSPEAVPVELDGDVAGVVPARFEILPGALTIRVPRRGGSPSCGAS